MGFQSDVLIEIFARYLPDDKVLYFTYRSCNKNIKGKTIKIGKKNWQYTQSVRDAVFEPGTTASVARAILITVATTLTFEITILYSISCEVINIQVDCVRFGCVR